LAYINKKFLNETEDWKDILKESNLTKDEYNYYSTNKIHKKIFEVVEVLKKLLLDKNLTIKILSCENKNLNKKNEELNKENIKLANQNMKLLKDSIFLKDNNNINKSKGLKSLKDNIQDSSMVNLSNNLFIIYYY
jgi:hypothetical protein